MKRINQRGFTLIELLISLFILSVVLLALSTMVYSVMRATAQSKGMATATTLAQDKMESLKNTSFTSPAMALGDYSDSPSIENITYNRAWKISNMDETTTPKNPPENIKKIKVTGSWTDRLPHNVSITTLRGE